VDYTDNVSPICLVPSCFDGDDQTVTAMGWGHTTDGGKNSHVLRHADLAVVNNDRCKLDWKESEMPNGALCAYAKGQDTCQVSLVALDNFDILYHRRICVIIQIS
jgi:hypothetical protein